jgi:hypothetical protein
VLLNRLLSRSSTRAPEEHRPETHGAEELLEIIEARRKKGWAIEYLDTEDNPDEEVCGTCDRVITFALNSLNGLFCQQHRNALKMRVHLRMCEIS